MKRIKNIIFITLLLIVSTITLNVKASTPPYQWVVLTEDGKRMDVTKVYSNVVLDKQNINEQNIYVLKLDNYNGKGLELECFGTGQSGMKFVIELTGNNVITADDIGINYTYSTPLEIKGNGSLTINAPTPIANENYIKSNINITNEEESKSETKEEIKDDTKEIEQEDTSLEELKNEEKNNNTIIYIIFGVYVLISLTTIIVLIIKLCQKKNKEVKKEDE